MAACNLKSILELCVGGTVTKMGFVMKLEGGINSGNSCYY
jgi:hypothetical protein